MKLNQIKYGLMVHSNPEYQDFSNMAFFRYEMPKWGAVKYLHVHRRSENLGTVLVLIKLTKIAVALRLRCGSCKLIF